MEPAKKRRATLLWGVGLALLLSGAGPATGDFDGEPTSDGVDLTVEPPSPLESGVLGPAAAAGESVVDGPLVGRPGAATALVVRDPEMALRLLDSVPAPAEGSADWFVQGALRGRALRMSGRNGEAVAALEPRAAHDAVEDFFPRDVLGFELARARVAWADGGELEATLADAQRSSAVSELSKLRRHSSLRNLAEHRVLQAEAMGGIEGDGDRARVRAAKKAVSAYGKIVADYPKHPRIGELRLAHARAMVRAGDVSDAADVLRRIAIERAGEPEAELAWAEFEALAAEHSKIKARGLSMGERLEAAMFARGLRRVAESRRILDEIIDDPDTSDSRRRQAQRSRSYTAYKQRDYETCVADLRPMYDAGSSQEVRDWLLRCYERGEMYDEALAIWQVRVDSDRSSTRANGLWNGLQLALRAGRYEHAQRWLSAYEDKHKGHNSERAWLRPWLAFRLGQIPEAIEGFRVVAKRSGNDGRRARYFLGRLLVQSADATERAEGVTELQQLAVGDTWGYYGLMARQRLLDAAAVVPPLPPLPAVPDEARRPGRAETEARLQEVDATFGDAWSQLRRTRQLYEAGYVEEARREFRHAARGYIDIKYGKAPGPRNESLFIGLGWKAEWEYPRARLSGSSRKTIRNSEQSEILHQHLRTLAHQLSEHYVWAKLSNGDDGPYKARWHPRAYRAPLEREARLREIDPVHLWSLMYTESRYRRFVVSPVGARGALQIMPWTGRQLAERLGELPEDGRFDSDTLFDIDTNAHLSAYYVSELLHKFHGQGPMAYASYNGGPSNVGRWLRAKASGGAPLSLDAFVEEIAFEESYRYAKRVTEVSAAYAMLYSGELPRWTNDVDPVVEDNIFF